MIGKKRLCAFLCAVLTLTQVVPVFAKTTAPTATKVKTIEWVSENDVKAITYDGTAGKVPAIVVKDVSGNVVDSANYKVDYVVKGKTVSADDVVNAGKVTVKVTGLTDKGFKGTLKKTYKVNPLSIVDSEGALTPGITVNGIDTVTFSVKPEVTVKFGATVLDKKAVSVKVTGYNKVGADKAKVTVKGKGNFTGTYSVKKAVDKYGLDAATITVKDVVLVSANNVVKKGKKNISKVTVKAGKKTVAASNYTVKYYIAGNEITASSNFAQYAAGTEVKVVVTAKDDKNFVGAAETTYYLSEKLLKAKDVKAAEGAKYADGVDAKTLITVKDVAADQYDVTILDTKAAGSTKTKVKLQITGKGVVGGTVVKTFKFAKAAE